MNKEEEIKKEIENPYAKGCGISIGYDRGVCKEGNICDDCMYKGRIWIEGYKKGIQEARKEFEKMIKN